ncbi:MAG: 16S rRNA (guanine(966)-N(2))-methyltransferase RsmD [Desulfuromonadaceae bacterium]
MRVIGGTARGKRLVAFSGSAIRPTPDRVRGAVFSMLFSRLGGFAGKKVLDLCSGTGAMAIEALSRGAAHAWLIDEGAQSASIIPNNLAACGFSERSTFLRTPALSALDRLRKTAPFDLIFLDPPYGKGLGMLLLERLAADEFLSQDGMICVETAKSDELPENVGGLSRTLLRNYGKTSIHLYLQSETEVLEQ